MTSRFYLLIGKAVKRVAALRGGGTALPGLVMEKLDRGFVGRTLANLPHGVVIISGTNGKTTTTKMVSELLTSAGLKVFTNRTGSNFVRGVAAALLDEVDSMGKLPHDIAVLELDEAHAVHFIRHVSARHVLVLNIMRDQLDRFGEIDHTARLLEKVVSSATESVVLNRDDPRVVALASKLDKSIDLRYFGASEELQKVFVSDDAFHSKSTNSSAPLIELRRGDVELMSCDEAKAVYKTHSKEYETTLKLRGVYNFLNAAGALALCGTILKDKADMSQLTEALSKVEPAFGRGEIVEVNGQPLELVLVKNPAGFRLALASATSSEARTMIAINDNYADGRDMSWLWDVDFTSLASDGVKVVSGVRAYDMALRLQYDEVEASKVEPDLKTALDTFISASNEPGRIFCTYTAMLKLRRLLKKYTTMEKMG